MKKKVQNFGCVFPINSGKHKGKYFYAYKDKEGTNQHSKIFRSVETCSQEFVVKFAEYLLREIKIFIKE